MARDVVLMVLMVLMVEGVITRHHQLHYPLLMVPSYHPLDAGCYGPMGRSF